MYEKSKTELLAMSIEDVKTHEKEVWKYYSKIQTIMKFMRLED
tara:strand:+ start:79 stop:207 length:129 start_codon:yes stop_codon:yes gene_type:complete